MFVAKSEDAKAEALQQMNDKKLSYNSVKMTQKSCVLMVAEPGFGVSSVL